MWKCPVCDRENTAATICPACGYDRSRDYEQYPTAFAVTNAKPTHALRREWQKKQTPPVNGGARRATVTITPEQAARGCRLEVTSPGGGTCQVTIPGGCTDGKKLRYTGLGHPGKNGGKSGDLLVTVRVQEPLPDPDDPDDALKAPPVNGGARRATVTITPKQAVRGCRLEVTSPGGGTCQVTIPGGCTDGKKLRYTGLGHPGKNGGKSGDLLVTVRVQEQAVQLVSVRVTPRQAARGCVKTVSLMKNASSAHGSSAGDKVSLKLTIPPGVIYGEKLHYSQVRAEDGTLFDLTAEIRVGANENAFRIPLSVGLGGLALVCLLYANWPDFIFFTALLCLFLKIRADGRNRRDAACREKYGPKTPGEQRRCETSREMPPQQ